MFKVGDVVTGINDLNYSITNSKSICEVVRVWSDGGMVVKVLKAEDDYHVGDRHRVEQMYFKLIEQKEVKKEVW